MIGACRNWKSAHVLDGTQIAIDGITFFGIGGGIPVTPFGSWSYDFTEKEAKNQAAVEKLSGHGRQVVAFQWLCWVSLHSTRPMICRYYWEMRNPTAVDFGSENQVFYL